VCPRPRRSPKASSGSVTAEPPHHLNIRHVAIWTEQPVIAWNKERMELLDRTILTRSTRTRLASVVKLRRAECSPVFSRLVPLAAAVSASRYNQPSPGNLAREIPSRRQQIRFSRELATIQRRCRPRDECGRARRGSHNLQCDSKRQQRFMRIAEGIEPLGRRGTWSRQGIPATALDDAKLPDHAAALQAAAQARTLP